MKTSPRGKKKKRFILNNINKLILFCFLTEWQQGESADDGAGEHLHQGRPRQEGELQGQDGAEEQEEQEEGWTGQVRVCWRRSADLISTLDRKDLSLLEVLLRASPHTHTLLLRSRRRSILKKLSKQTPPPPMHSSRSFSSGFHQSSSDSLSGSPTQSLSPGPSTPCRSPAPDHSGGERG